MRVRRLETVLPTQPSAVTTDHDEERVNYDGQSSKRRFCVTADLLIPGRGEPVEKGCVIVEGSEITFVGLADDAMNMATLPKTHVRVIMPGMWDCHVHMTGLQKLDVAGFVSGSQNQALIGARCANDARLLLNAGFTSVRDLAGCGIQIDTAIEEGSIVGPRIYSANCLISPTGGHADIHSMHKPWYDDACCHGLPLYTTDGVPECLKAVRMQLREGAKLIKFAASGGVATELDDPTNQQFSQEEMTAIVEEATRAKRAVACHVHGKPGIAAALHAGVKTIEHGSFLDEEDCDLMIEKDAIFIATRLIIENGLADSSGFAPYAYEKLVKLAGAHWESIKLAVRKGVKMAVGTDSSGSVPGSERYTFGVVGRELGLLVKAGMTPLQAIEAATANAAETLGPQAPKAGMLKEGYDADFIALDQDPLEEIGVLGEAEHVTHVWRQGRLYKSPERPLFSP